MNVFLENDHLKIGVKTAGAELFSVYHKGNDLEYMWSGNPQYWGKTSPVLFPIVGLLKDNTVFHEGKAYQLPRHGYARDCVFAVENQTPTTATFALKSDEKSREMYPFDYVFRLHYVLEGTRLSVTHDVENGSERTMYFSVGGHPAFKVPLVEGTHYEDYRIALPAAETVGRYPLSNEGLIAASADPFLIEADSFGLRHDLFYADAIVLKELKAKSMRIVSDKTPHGLNMTFEGFPLFGIWASKDAPFVCLEPWCGIADTVSTTQQLSEKEGINALSVGERFERTWTIDVF